MIEVPFTFAAIDKPRAKYLELVESFNAARRHVRDLEAGREAAKKIDRAKYAERILKSGPLAKDPGRVAEEKLEQDLEQAQHLCGSLKSAVEQAEEALVDAVERERAGILKSLDKERDKAEREYGECAEALLTARRERDELERLRTQVSRFPQPVKASTVERPFPIKMPNGQHASHAQFERALREDVNGPTPKANTMPRPETPNAPDVGAFNAAA
jgi:hypothetical protein